MYKTISSQTFLPFAVLEVDQKQMTRRSIAGSPASVRRQASGRDSGIVTAARSISCRKNPEAGKLIAEVTLFKLIPEVTAVKLVAKVTVLKLVAEVTAVKLVAEGTRQTTDVCVATLTFTDNLTTYRSIDGLYYKTVQHSESSKYRASRPEVRIQQS